MIWLYSHRNLVREQPKKKVKKSKLFLLVGETGTQPQVQFCVQLGKSSLQVHVASGSAKKNIHACSKYTFNI